jgi:hypothetical protein
LTALGIDVGALVEDGRAGTVWIYCRDAHLEYGVIPVAALALHSDLVHNPVERLPSVQLIHELVVAALVHGESHA